MNLADPADVNNSTEKTLVVQALDALRKTTGIEGKFIAEQANIDRQHQADAIVELEHGSVKARYVVTAKGFIDRKAQIDQVHRQLASTAANGLMIIPHITRELAAHCRVSGLQFIDTDGNAYLRAPGLFVLITGEKNGSGYRTGRAPKGLTNAASLRVVFGLLSKPELIDASFKDIAHATGVSLGTAYNVLQDLERRGYLVDRAASARRRLLERGRLVDEWAMNFPTTLRAKLNVRRFTASDKSWWKNVDLRNAGALWGAEIAGSKMSTYLKPATQTMYVAPKNLDGLVKVLAKQFRIKPDQHGEIEIVEKFWDWDARPHSDVVPPLLVYAELLAMMDPRTEEMANIIRERFIDATFDQT